MFAEVKAMLTFIKGDDYDEEIAREIKACELVLTRTSDIVLPGKVDITITKLPATTSEPERVIITDTSTIDDDMVFKVFATWCNMQIGNPPNIEHLRDTFKELRGSMCLSKNYTVYGEVTTE